MPVAYSAEWRQRRMLRLWSRKRTIQAAGTAGWTPSCRRPCMIQTTQRATCCGTVSFHLNKQQSDSRAGSEPALTTTTTQAHPATSTAWFRDCAVTGPISIFTGYFLFFFFLSFFFFLCLHVVGHHWKENETPGNRRTKHTQQQQQQQQHNIVPTINQPTMKSSAAECHIIEKVAENSVGGSRKGWRTQARTSRSEMRTKREREGII